ncbi:MAG: hypothetical protein RLZZ175_2479 [Bacteroidota bacterium]|jgi:hypothetical protein
MPKALQKLVLGLILLLGFQIHSFAQKDPYKKANTMACKCLEEKIKNKDKIKNWNTAIDDCVKKAMYGNLKSIAEAKNFSTSDASTIKKVRTEFIIYLETNCPPYLWCIDFGNMQKSGDVILNETPPER